MITLVLAAGKSQRFKDAGYNKPKQLLKMPDDINTMFSCAVRGLPNDFITVINEDVFMEWDWVVNLLLITKDNYGPLNTATQALKRLSSHPDQELLVVYSDVLFDDYDRFLLKCRLDDCDSGCVLFPANGDRFDFHSDGWAYGAVYYFESFNRFLIEAKTKLINADLKDNLYGKICTYKVRSEQHIDLGTPEDYEQYMERCKNEKSILR